MLTALLCYLSQATMQRRRLLQEFAWVAVGQVLSLIGGFVGIKVLTNLMSLRSYGEMALGLTVVGALAMFVYGPLG